MPRRPTSPRTRFLLANSTIVLDEIVYLALVPLLPTYAERFDLSKTQVGLLYAAYPLLGLASALPAGILCDRIGARRLLLGANALFLVATIGFATSTGFLALWLARAAQGLASGATATAGMTMITGTADEARRGTRIGLAAALQGLSALGGPALGGLLVPFAGERIAFGVPAVAAAFVLAGLARDTTDADGRRPGVPRRGLLAVLADADGRLAASQFLAIGLVGGCVQTLATLELGAQGLSAERLGVLFIVAGLAGFPVIAVAGRYADRSGLAAATRAWLAVEVGVCLALAATHTRWVVLLGLGVLVTQIRVGGTIAYVRGARAGSAGGLAAGFGFMVTAWAVGASIGPIVAGALADTTGDAAAYLVSAVAFASLVGPGALRRND